MINPASKSVYLVFVPLQPFENSTTLRELLLSIVQYATFVGDEDSSYIRDYIRILNTGINFSSFELEQYVNQMSGRQSSGEMFVECPHCHIRLKKTASYCGNCGTKLSGQSGPLNRTVYDPIMEDRQTPAEPPRPDPRPAPPSAKGETGSLSSTSGATTVLGVTNGTTVLGGAEPLPQYPYLIREKDRAPYHGGQAVVPHRQGGTLLRPVPLRQHRHQPQPRGYRDARRAVFRGRSELHQPHLRGGASHPAGAGGGAVRQYPSAAGQREFYVSFEVTRKGQRRKLCIWNFL